MRARGQVGEVHLRAGGLRVETGQDERAQRAGRDRREVIGGAVGSDLEPLAESRREQPPSGFDAVDVEPGLGQVTDQVSLATLGVEHSALRAPKLVRDDLGGRGRHRHRVHRFERGWPRHGSRPVSTARRSRRAGRACAARRTVALPNELTWFARYCMYQNVSLRTPFLTWPAGNLPAVGASTSIVTALSAWLSTPDSESPVTALGA